MNLTAEEKAEIVANIKNAKDKRKQVEIEADLHATSKAVIKTVLREYGFNLRLLNGENFMKKEKSETPEEQSEPEGADWSDLAIPPLEPPEKKKVKYKKPELLEELPLPNSSETEENAAERPECIKEVAENDCFIIGSHVLEADDIVDAIGEKIHKLIDFRHNLISEIEQIDNYLRKYAYFGADLTEIIGNEGIEI